MNEMKDACCDIYLFYRIDGNELELYAWTTKKKIAREFMRTRDMSKFIKKERIVCASELEDFFYEYGDNFISIQMLSYGISNYVKVAATKKESVAVKNIVNFTFIKMQEALINININVFTKEFKKNLNIIGADKCIFSMQINSPPIQKIYGGKEFEVFLSEYGELMSDDFLDNTDILEICYSEGENDE